jgi:hypothetical protein
MYRRRPERLLAVGCLATACVAMVAGCGASGGSAAPARGATATSLPPVPASPPASGIAASVALPLDAYEPSSPDQAQLTNAMHELQSRCAAKQGFSYDPSAIPEAGTNSVMTPGQGEDYDFGLTSMSWAERYGYHHATSGPAGPAGSKPPKPPAMSVAEQQVVHRCIATVRREIGLGRSAPWILSEAIAFEASSGSRADPRVLQVFAKWSACMKAKGYDYATPLDAAEGIPGNGSQQGPGQWDTPGPTQAEIETADADVSCKAQTNLVVLWSSVLAAYQNVAINKNITRLRAGMASFDATLEKAQALLGQQG